jgi:hypothetical protein
VGIVQKQSGDFCESARALEGVRSFWLSDQNYTCFGFPSYFELSKSSTFQVLSTKQLTGFQIYKKKAIENSSFREFVALVV